MITWGELAAARPDLTEAGRAILYQFGGVGLGFLATVRPDGAPRLHPVCPLIRDGGLFAFIIPSPKLADLRRDGRYSLHTFPRPDDEDALLVSGRAIPVADYERRALLGEQFVSERAAQHIPPPAADDGLFELLVDRCLLTRTTGHGDPAPVHTVWRGA
jgi:hypothetical protein